MIKVHCEVRRVRRRRSQLRSPNCLTRWQPVRSPQRWDEKRDALRGQLTRALNLAARKLEPKVQPVTPPRRILRNEADLDAWVAEVRKTVLTKLAEGPVQI